MNWPSIIGIALWALLPGFIARKKGRSFWAYYFLSFVITPLLTTLITLCLSKIDAEDSNQEPPYMVNPTTTAEKVVVERALLPSQEDEKPSTEIEINTHSDPPKESTSMIFNSRSVQEPESKQENPAETDNNTSARPVFCRKCGTKLGNNVLFCHRCGTKVIEE